MQASGRPGPIQLPGVEIPPSEATIQYPAPSGVEAMPLMGLFNAMVPALP